MRVSHVVLIVTVVLLIVYGRYYLKYNKDIEILQVYLDSFKLDLLYERYPILIYDQVYDHKDLLQSIFAYSYMFSKNEKKTPSIPRINRSKFVLLSSEKDCVVNIINPRYEKEAKLEKPFKDTQMQYVSVKLRANQVLILPSRWIYQSNSDLEITTIDDMLSPLFLRFIA